MDNKIIRICINLLIISLCAVAIYEMDYILMNDNMKYRRDHCHEFIISNVVAYKCDNGMIYVK